MHNEVMHGEGADVGEEAAAWVSEFLQVEGCQIYHMSPQGAPGRQTRVSLERRLVINPRRACAAKVTVLGLCVCVVCLLLNISLYT